MSRSLRASQHALDDIVDPARIKKHWNQHDEEWAKAADVSLKTLQRFWDRELIRRENFIAICQAIEIEDWKAIADFPPQPPSFFLYRQETWTGRVSLIEKTLSQFNEETRIVWITGISGIGKSTLGECLASQAWEHESSFQWLSLEVEEQRPYFTSVVDRWLFELKEPELNPQERNNPEQAARRLFKKLQAQPYWIQLDSVEHLLNPDQPTEFVDPYWVTFLQRCLTDLDFGCRLVLTSQALPQVLVEFSDRYPNVWSEIRLDGLSEQGEWMDFFAKRGVNEAEASDRDTLIRIANTYEGHPLVLTVIAEDILKQFAGDVARYWQVNQPEFEQVARELQATRLDEQLYNEVLDAKVRERIKKSLVKLPTDALDLLCRSSVFRRPVIKPFWLAMIEDRTAQQQKEAYRVLSDRALVEREGYHQTQPLIRLHNLIRDVSYDLLKADQVVWEQAERQAANLWITAYQSALGATNLETVQGYLEAINHYWQVGGWDEASKIYMSRLETTNEILHQQLLVWGQYQELIEISRRLVPKASSDVKITCFLSLGNATSFLGNQNESIEWQKRALFTAIEVCDQKQKAAALGNLGKAYFNLGQFDEAISFHEQALDVSIDINDILNESLQLGGLGNVYHRKGQYDKALIYYQKQLTKSQEIKNRLSESNALGGLGLTYHFLGEFELAINLHQQSLAIRREIGNRQGEGIALGNLGIAYLRLGQYQKAIDIFLQRLIIAREIRDRLGESNVLGNLGIAYFRLEDYGQAINCFNQNLEIANEIGDRAGQGRCLGNLGCAYCSLGDFEQAINLQKEYLKISIETGDHWGEGEALVNLGLVELKLNQYSNSLAHNQLALEIFQELGAKPGESEALKNLAEVHQALGEIEVARQYAQQALALATELGIPLTAECEALLQGLDSTMVGAQNESTR